MLVQGRHKNTHLDVYLHSKEAQSSELSENRHTAEMDSLIKEKVCFLKYRFNTVEEVQECIYLFGEDGKCFWHSK